MLWFFHRIEASIKGLANRQSERQAAREGAAQHIAVELGGHQPIGRVLKGITPAWRASRPPF